MASSVGVVQRRPANKVSFEVDAPAGPVGPDAAPQAAAAPPDKLPAAFITDEIARKGLVWTPVAWWIVCVLAGVYGHQDVMGRPSHPLKWFDQLIFRTFGAMLPFCFLFPRWLVGRLTGRPATWAPQCLAVYLAMSAVRLLFYLAHLHTAGRDTQLISDHIYLAASVVGCLQLELVCIVNDTVRWVRENGEDILVTLVGCTGMVGAALCILLTSVDMFYTAKYYHHQQESLQALFLGMVTFQGPVLWLLV
jgi:hypothetical protein